jgi:hypothetical protein
MNGNLSKDATSSVGNTFPHPVIKLLHEPNLITPNFVSSAVSGSSLYKLSSLKGVNTVIKDIRLISSVSEINKVQHRRISDSSSLSTRQLIELVYEIGLI